MTNKHSGSSAFGFVVKTTALLLAGLACLLALSTALLFSEPLKIPQLDLGIEEPEPRSVFFAPSSAATTESRSSVEDTAFDTTGPVGPTRTSIDAFRFYVDTLGSLDAETRRRELQVRASALKKMTVETRALLLMEDVSDLRVEMQFGSRDAKIPIRLVHELLRHWVRHAEAEEEDLLGAILGAFDASVAQGLVAADAVMVRVAVLGLHHYADPVSVEIVAPRVLAALRSVPNGAPLSPVIRDLLLGYIATAAWESTWLRPAALALVASEWMTEPSRASYLIQLTCRGRFEDWEASILQLIADGSPSGKWGAVESIRGFMARKKMTIDQLIATLPKSLYFHEYTPLRWGTLELVSRFGGEPGRQLLLALLFDAANPDRPSTLSFLAFRCKVPFDVCVKLLRSEDTAMRNAALDALGHLAKVQPESLAALREFMRGCDDAELRRLTLRALGNSDSDTVLSDYIAALDDADPMVQAEAVTRIGRHEGDTTKELRQIIDDHRMAPVARQTAYTELLLDIRNHDVQSVVDSMHEDRDPQIRSAGYIMDAALAVIDGDDSRLEQWARRPIPDAIYDAVDFLPSPGTAVGGAIKSLAASGVKAEIMNRLAAHMRALMDGDVQDRLDRFAADGDSPLAGNHLLSIRILDYLRFRAKQKAKPE